VKIVVCVKQTLSLPGPIEFLADGSDVDPVFTERSLNEADLHAIEEGLRLSDDHGGEVVVVTAGTESTIDVLRQGLAMGAHRALHVAMTHADTHDAVAVGRALAAAIDPESPDLVLCGVQSGDGGQQSTGPAVAAALGRPCVSVATSLERSETALRVHREVGGGLVEVVEVDLPALVTVQTGINEPRYGTFKDKMAANKADIPTVDSGPSETGTRVRRVFVPPDDGSRATLIGGGPDAVAAHIVELLSETD
jgi:electron transfer flavoprotein beta subunit